MTPGKPTNVAASVRQKLLNVIRETEEDPNLVWTRYTTERLLYRLSVSPNAGEFILKGALLFLVWAGKSYRPTVDIDLLGRGEDSSDRLVEVFRAVCGTNVEPDGVHFDPQTVTAAPIRREHEYHGQRVSLTASIGKARISVIIDVGFGDVVVPRAKKVQYPSLLGFPAPSIRAYPRETVVAEKFQAMVHLGIVNSRMKDFYDLHVLARDFAFNGKILAQAVKATFRRRKTDIPTKPPLALTDEFGHDEVKSTQWNAFIRKNRLENVPGLMDLLSDLKGFLLPVMNAVADDAATPGNWKVGGPWHH
jgi:hypothetical protein